MQVYRQFFMGIYMHITEKNKKRIGAAIIIISLLFMVAVCLFLGAPLVKFAREPEKFRNLVSSFGVWGYFIFVLIIFFQVVFAFIPGEPFELFAGYAFGSFSGLILCMIGSCLGSAAVFLLTRKFGIKFVELFFSMDKINSVKFLRNKKKMYVLTFLAFFIPGTPKDLLSYAAGLTPINFWTYLLLSSVARIPSVITSTVSGSAFNTKKYVFGIAVFAVTGIISVIGILIYNKISADHTVNLAKYIGKTVTVQMSAPYSGSIPACGFVRGIWSSEGDVQDAYVLGVKRESKIFTGKVIGYVRNKSTMHESLITVPKHTAFSKEEICKELSEAGEFDFITEG